METINSSYIVRLFSKNTLFAIVFTLYYSTLKFHVKTPEFLFWLHTFQERLRSWNLQMLTRMLIFRQNMYNLNVCGKKEHIRRIMKCFEALESQKQV